MGGGGEAACSEAAYTDACGRYAAAVGLGGGTGVGDAEAGEEVAPALLERLAWWSGGSGGGGGGGGG